MSSTPWALAGALAVVALGSVVPPHTLPPSAAGRVPRSAPGRVAKSLTAGAPTPHVVALVGNGPTVWLMERVGPRVSLWQQRFGGRWHRLAWPSAQMPVDLIRTSLQDAWVVTQNNQVWTSSTGGRAWHPVALPPLLATHRQWPQTLELAVSPNGALTLLASGPEQAIQCAKLLWYRAPDHTQWKLVARSDAGLFAPPWWPRRPAVTWSVAGDPLSWAMVSNHLGYLVDEVAGGPFLFQVTDQGRTVRPAAIHGLSRPVMEPGVAVWNGADGWILGNVGRQGTPGVVHIRGSHARLIAVPRPIVPDAVTSAQAAVATIVGRDQGRWILLNTQDGGQRWSSVPLRRVSDPGGHVAPLLYRFRQGVWLLLGRHLYAGADNTAQGWHRVALP